MKIKRLVWLAVAAISLIILLIVLSLYVDEEQPCPSEHRIEEIHNVILLDMSSSMKAMGDEPVRYLNGMIDAIRAAQDSVPEISQFISVAVFNYPNDRMNHRFLRLGADPGSVGHIEKGEYVPLGATPLYDAIAATVDSVAWMSTMVTGVLMTIITDGKDNSSEAWSVPDVKHLVDSLSKDDWRFTFIGADQDEVMEGRAIGIDRTIGFEGTADGYKEMGAESRRIYEKDLAGLRARGNGISK